MENERDATRRAAVWQKTIDAIVAQVQAAAVRFEGDTGEPWPTTVEDWMRLARRAGMNFDDAWAGEYTIREIEPLIRGYFQSLQDAKQLRELVLPAIRPTPPTGGQVAPVDLLTTDELAWLAGVGKPRLLNVISAARTAGNSDLPDPAERGSGSRSDKYSYAAIRPFLIRNWQVRARAGIFAESFAEVKAWLALQMQDD